MKHFISKLIIAFSALWIIPWGLSAQSFIRWNATSLQTSKAIVRDWRMGYSIGYMEDMSGNALFFLKDNGNMLTWTALKNGYSVNDFRVNNDSVFFCGMDKTTGVGVIGFFDINALFAGTDPISLGQLVPPLPFTQTYVTCPNRMDIYYFNGSTHIAFVGDMQTEDPTTGATITSSTIGCAYWNGTNWIIDFHTNPVGNLKYTDIAASSSYIAAVATNASPDYLIQVFKMNNDFVPFPLNYGNVFQVSSFAPLGNILLDDISATDFVLAYQYTDGEIPCTKLQQFHVDLATQSIVLQLTLLTNHGNTAPHHSSSWSMKQLCYDSTVPRILLLQDAATATVPSVESSFFSYTPSGIASGHVDVFFIPSVVLDRMDAKPTGGYWAIGNEGGALTLANEIFPSTPATSCHEGYQLDCDIITETPTNRTYYPTNNPFMRPRTTLSQPLESEELHERCIE